MLRVRLSGDHSSLHAGCRAVWTALRESVRSGGFELVAQETDFDLLVVNGEGSMHHGSSGFHRKMRELARSLELGKRACLVNSVWQSNPNDYDRVLNELDLITVREVHSQQDLLLRHGVESDVVPDLSLCCPLQPDLPAIDFAGQTVVTDFFSREWKHFVRMTGGQLSAHSYFDLTRGNWGTAVASLSTAGLLLTGRQHAVYAACVARTPFLALEGNSHKIQGLMATAGVAIPVFSSPLDLISEVKHADQYRDEYQKLFDWCASRPTWQLAV